MTPSAVWTRRSDAEFAPNSPTSSPHSRSIREVQGNANEASPRTMDSDDSDDEIIRARESRLSIGSAFTRLMSSTANTFLPQRNTTDSARTADSAAEEAAKQAEELNEQKLNERVRYLSKVPELKTLLLVEKKKIALAMSELQCPRNHVIFRQGETGDTFYVLKEGCVRILENGVEVSRLTADRASNPYFGEKALFRNQPRAATVVVQSESACVLALDRESFTMHLGPLEYFFGIHDDEAGSEDGGDKAAPDPTASTGGGDPLGARGGDPFQGLTGTANARPGATRDVGQDTTATLIDNKLWALGMSHEQLAKSKLRKHRDKVSRLSRWPRWRVRVYTIYHSKVLKTVMCAFIIVNTACLCVIVSYPPGESLVFWMVTILCKAVFLVEVVVRVMSCAKERWSGWLLLDMLLLCIAVVELLVMAWREQVGRVLPVLATIQSLRLVRFLRLFKVKMSPLRVILTALGSGLSYVLSAGLFVGMIWLTAAICFTALLAHTSSEDRAVQQALEHFSSTGRSLLSALEITVGGMCWGSAIFDPLISSDKLSWKFGGVAVLILVILSSFLIWNLILGIYVRQVTVISKKYDNEEEQEALFDGENSVKHMRALLDKMDMDKDGCISKKELRRLLKDTEALTALRLGAQELQVLHASLDAESNGHVSISDFLFGVLKLTGASKTLDMLSIDYRQKALLRCITQLEKSSAAQLDALSADLDALYAYAAYLDRRIRALHKSVIKAKADLMMEIERMGRLAERERRQAQQNQMLVDARRRQENLEVRSKLESQLDSLQAEINHLSRERQLQCLTSAGGIEVAAIRKAVRERLDREVGPWLDRELASLKLTS